MRSLPVLLLALAGVTGVALGLYVMSGATRPGVPGEPGQPGGVPAELGGVPQGHVYTGVAEEPDDVNPFTAHHAVARRLVLAHTHDALLDLDPATGGLRPALAERYELAADGSSCTFTLRDGVRFSDGAPLSLADVLFGWELARAGHLPLGFVGDAFARVQDVEVLDERSFRVRFPGPHFAALRVVGENWLVGSRAWWVAQVAARSADGVAPPVDSPGFALLLDQIDQLCGPGTGAYMLDSAPDGPQPWRRRQDLLLVRNQHSWRRVAFPGTWNFAGMRILFRDQHGGTNALLRGEVDVFSSPMLDELLRARPELERDYRRLEYDYETLGVFRVVWNCQRPPFDDARVRRALGMLFDCESMLARFGGLGRRALAHAKPTSPAYPSELEPVPFDPAASRRLLREAGFDPEQGRPLRVVLLAMQGTEVLRRIVDLFSDAAQRAGVLLEVRARDFPAFVTEKKRREWDGMLVLQSFRASGDPYDLLHSQGADNDGGFANAEVDRLAAAARVELDAGRRAALWRDLHRIVHAEQPAALLVHPLATILLARRLQQVAPGPGGLVLERAFVPIELQRP